MIPTSTERTSNFPSDGKPKGRGAPWTTDAQAEIIALYHEIRGEAPDPAVVVLWAQRLIFGMTSNREGIEATIETLVDLLDAADDTDTDACVEDACIRDNGLPGDDADAEPDEDHEGDDCDAEFNRPEWRPEIVREDGPRTSTIRKQSFRPGFPGVSASRR